MNKFLLSAAVAGLIAAPQAASAAAYAFASFEADNVIVTFSNAVTPSGESELFSSNAAALGMVGALTQADNDVIPGVADAASAQDPDGLAGENQFGAVLGGGPDGARSDSILSAESVENLSFNTVAEGYVTDDFVTALGEVTAAYSFSNSIADTVITIVLDATQVFNLTTDNEGDVASGRTALAWTVIDAAGTTVTPDFTQTGTCDFNSNPSVANGEDFAETCSTTLTFTFTPLAIGDFTLGLSASSSIDATSEQAIDTPAPAASASSALASQGWAWRAVVAPERFDLN